jgi:arylsulfatase A-like enzyme
MKALQDGLLVGALLAATETAAAVVTSRHIPPSYLLAVTAFDLGCGLVAGAIAAILVRVLPRRPDGDFARRFVALAGGALTVYAADKVVMAAVFRAWPVAAVVGALVAIVATFVFVAYRVCHRLTRTRQAEASTILSLVILVPAVLAARHAGAEVLHRRSGPLILAAAGLLALAAVAAFIFQDRWFAHRQRPTAVQVRRAVVAAALVVVAGSLALARTRARPDPAPDFQGRRAAASARPNVLLISVDTLRADRLSLYGYDRDTSPMLRRLAAESVVFTRAVSPGTWTLPGHAAMFTGRFPGSLGALAIGAQLPSEAVTLAERLAEGGYRTGAVVANASSLAQRLGWGQGFSAYSDEPERLFAFTPSLNTALWSFPVLRARVAGHWKSAQEVNRIATEWLAGDTTAPFFLFINYMDTHSPYVAPGEWPDRYPGRLRFLVEPVPAVMRDRRDLTARESLHYKALYDGAVAYVDHEIGRLLAELGTRGDLDNTLVIVTSDHGEFFGEHRLFHHEIGPYEPVHRIPLIIRYPRAAHVGVEHGWAQLVDVMPTVLDAIGVPQPAGMDGEVLPRVRHPILIQQAPHPWSGRLHGRGLGRGYTGLYEGSHKLVSFDDGSSMMFDLDQDPGETRNLMGADAQQARLMRDRLAAANARYPIRPGERIVDPEVQERLRAGGYLQ